MIYITYYTLEMKRQTMSVMLVNEYKKTRSTVEEAAVDYSRTTVMLMCPPVDSGPSFVPWDEMCLEEELFPDENENDYQGLPGSCYRNDMD